MIIKKYLIGNQPKYNETSQYNFEEGYTADTPLYNDSISLPDNNGKFEKKDLQTSEKSSLAYGNLFATFVYQSPHHPLSRWYF